MDFTALCEAFVRRTASDHRPPTMPDAPPSLLQTIPEDKPDDEPGDEPEDQPEPEPESVCDHYPPSSRPRSAFIPCVRSTAWSAPKDLVEDKFTPAVPCCRKQTPCYMYFSTREVKSWRNDLLFITTESRETTRGKLHEHREEHKVPGGKAYCVAFLSWWTGWSSTFLYARGTGLGTKPGPKTEKDITVMSWFGMLKQHLEMMPDTNAYQVNAAQKTDLYDWYKEDVVQHPHDFIHVSKPYFLAVWRSQVPEVVLRKVLRFNKCPTCEMQRQIRWDRNRSVAERSNALTVLTIHYKFIKGERAYAMVSAHKGIMDPRNCLSMAQDGTSQLPRGLPQFAQALHGQEAAHNRLHHHITLTIVLGRDQMLRHSRQHSF